MILIPDKKGDIMGSALPFLLAVDNKEPVYAVTAAMLKSLGYRAEAETDSHSSGNTVLEFSCSLRRCYMTFLHSEDPIFSEPEFETRNFAIPSQSTFMRYRSILS